MIVCRPRLHGLMIIPIRPIVSFQFLKSLGNISTQMRRVKNNDKKLNNILNVQLKEAAHVQYCAQYKNGRQREHYTRIYIVCQPISGIHMQSLS